MPWEGSQLRRRDHLVPASGQDDVLTSIHIEEHEVDARDTKLGPEEITRDIPNIPKRSSQTSTSAGSCASVPRSAPVTSWSARSRPKR